jgi:hypothetical protein
MVMRCLPGALPQARVVRAFSPLLVLREQLRSNPIAEAWFDLGLAAKAKQLQKQIPAG